MTKEEEQIELLKEILQSLRDMEEMLGEFYSGKVTLNVWNKGN